jgi:transcription termination factor Rho
VPEDQIETPTPTPRRTTRRRSAVTPENATPPVAVQSQPPSTDEATTAPSAPRARRTRAVSAAASAAAAPADMPASSNGASEAKDTAAPRKSSTGSRARGVRKLAPAQGAPQEAGSGASGEQSARPSAETITMSAPEVAHASGPAADFAGAHASPDAPPPAAEATPPQADDAATRSTGGEHARGTPPAQRPSRPVTANEASQGQRPMRRDGDQRPMRQATRPGAPLTSGHPSGLNGQPGRSRFERPGVSMQRPGQSRGAADQQGGRPRQGQGDQAHDRRPVQPPHQGVPGRSLPPQRGQSGRPATPGRSSNDRGTRGTPNQPGGGYSQPGYIVPGYGVPQYSGHSDRGQRPNQPRMRAPVPPAPVVPARTVEVQGVLWVRGNTAELLDERGTLLPLATVPFGDVQRMGLRAGDVLHAHAEERGTRRQVTAIDSVNNRPPEQARERPTFEQLTAISPRQRITLEHGPRPLTSRIIDLFSPLGFGSRALVVAPPKTGKTTFLRETAESVLTNYPAVLVMACLVGERPEEVTDLRGALEPRGGLVYAASFDEVQERHAWLVQVTIERAKRVAETGGDVVVLLDSLTRLARAENLTGRAMGRTLSGGIDAQALDTGRRAFGAARCLEEGGSLTIMATCLVDTGSRQDDVVYEEFKGTGNMELHLSRELAQRRLFPAVDAVKSGTRKEELLLSPEELRATTALRRRLADMPLQQATTQLLGVLERTPSNAALLQAIEQSGWNSATR